MITAIAFVPSTPMLIPEVASGASDELDLARTCSIDAIRGVIDGADAVVVLGVGARTRHLDDAVGSFEGFGVPVSVSLNRNGVAETSASTSSTDVGLASTVGIWLLSQTQWQGRNTVYEVAADETQDGLAQVATDVAASPGSTALIIVADGSAARTEKSPGYLHPDATAFDGLVEQALLEGNPALLASLDRGQADSVMAAGWPAWQVAALSLEGREIQARCDYSEAPYGVGYFVATWACS